MLERLKAIWASVWADLVDTYKRLKVLLIAIGACILYLEWEKIKAALLVYSGKKEQQSSQKEDQVLAQKEQAVNQEADDLVKKADNEPNPGNDWYKK